MGALALGGCFRGAATGALADALSGTGGAYSRDDDPELVEDALPFALKTMESVIPEQPEHRGLLAATAGGFTQYAYGFLKEKADAIESKDREKAAHLRRRAKNLLRRGRGYGFQGLAVEHENFEQRLRQDAQGTLAEVEKDEVPLLYWTAAALAAEVTLDKDDLELVADLPLSEAMMRRALELDEAYEQGAIHEFLMTYELSRPDGGPQSATVAEKHFQRARELSQGKRLSVLVSWAENALVKRQAQKEFLALLDEVLAFDVNTAPEQRLANVIAQRRAQRLKARVEELFL
jgi:hypothetical protein